MRYRFQTCDVFTTTRFGGNQLAVLPRAEGLGDREMQAIAREFNLAETAFVFPPEAGHTRKVRIFTPTCEVPFAGHPNIGAAAMLAAHGELGEIGATCAITFEEAAGVVPIVLERRAAGRWHGTLEAPAPLSLGDPVPLAAVAAAASLTEADLVTSTHVPHHASVGLGFLIAEVRDRATLARARPDVAALTVLGEAFGQPYLHLYARSTDDFDLRARQFSASDPLLEDPATGSANAALAGLLLHYDRSGSTSRHWRIAQGVEMGRPSVIDARATRVAQGIRVEVGGEVVGVAEGTLEV